MMRTPSGEDRTHERLRGLYEHEGEAAVRAERDEVKHQTDRACSKLEEVTNGYLTALAAVHSAGQLIDIYDASDACGDVHHFAGSVLWKEPIRVQLEIPDDVENPDYVEGAIEAVEQCSENEHFPSPGYWLREKTTVEAVPEGGERILLVSAQAPLEEAHEEAKAERRRLSEEVRNQYREFEELRLQLRRYNDFLSEVLRGEEPLPPEAKRRKLRGIAEDHTEDIEAVRDYLDDCPSHAWPDSRTDVFRSAFPQEEPKNVFQRFHNWWERDRDLGFPKTVQELHQECRKALSYRDDFLLSQQDSQQVN